MSYFTLLSVKALCFVFFVFQTHMGPREVESQSCERCYELTASCLRPAGCLCIHIKLLLKYKAQQ